MSPPPQILGLLSRENLPQLTSAECCNILKVKIWKLATNPYSWPYPTQEAGSLSWPTHGGYLREFPLGGISGGMSRTIYKKRYTQDDYEYLKSKLGDIS